MNDMLWIMGTGNWGSSLFGGNGYKVLKYHPPSSKAVFFPRLVTVLELQIELLVCVLSNDEWSAKTVNSEAVVH